MSPGPDTMILSALERHNLPALFAALPLLRDLDSEVLAEITREVEWFSVPGGATLYEAGQPADGLYVVVNGTLGLFAPQAGGGSRPSGRVAAGETVGEAEVISGTNRTIANVVIKRLDSLQHAGTQARATPKTFVVVPSGEDVDAAKFAVGLARCLKAHGRTELVLSTQGHEQTSHWFHRLERSNDFVVYIADSLQTNWTRLCLRQADCVLLLARSDGEPRAWHGLEAHLDAGSAGRSIELVLIGRPQSLATARRWLDLHQVRRHHHVRNADDLARVVRLLTGRALAVVLSGGGARGFAHIGVLRALQAAMLPVDAIGATSIGAIIGAGWAAGWGY
ncbi:MAG: cyclic nucleotide-binding domain-containing protein, partial [Gammaproteobacteria bacterium]